MLELIVFFLAFAADAALKLWSMQVLSAMPGGQKPLVPGVIWLQYAENHATNVSFIRSQHPIMLIARGFILLFLIYVLVRFRKNKLRLLTRIGISIFIAGMLGNQLNYFLQDFVPDMFALGFWPLKSYIFNLADVMVVSGFVTFVISLCFHEGQEFITWLINKIDPPKRRRKRRSRQSQPPPIEQNDGAGASASSGGAHALPPPIYAPLQSPGVQAPQSAAHDQGAATPSSNPAGWPAHLPPPRGEY